MVQPNSTDSRGLRSVLIAFAVGIALGCGLSRSLLNEPRADSGLFGSGAPNEVGGTTLHAPDAAFVNQIIECSANRPTYLASRPAA
jgi:hypothetical protein